VVISDGKALQSSRQVSDYKFCAECEGRLNKGGEDWVLKNVPRDYGGPFSIHRILSNGKPRVIGKEFLLFARESVPGIDIDSLIYFGMSVFWRGTQSWSPVEGGRPAKVHLGRYERSIRMFLLGKGGLPQDVVLTVAVWPYKKVHPMTLFPRQDIVGGVRRYWFYFSGFIFLLTTGKKISLSTKETCAYHRRVITLSTELGKLVWNLLRNEFHSLDKSKIAGMLEQVAAIRAKESST
jgi:hypothetical protein